MHRLARISCVTGALAMALTSLAGLPIANAAVDAPIAVWGGGGGGGGGSKGMGTAYLPGSGGAGGATGQFSETAPAAESGENGTDGTAHPSDQNVGINGDGGNGARGWYQVGPVSTVTSGIGRVGTAGGSGASVNYQYSSATEAATVPSVTVVAGNGGGGGDASVNAGGAGGNGGNSTAMFWRIDTVAQSANYPDALTVAGAVLVRSGIRGVEGAWSLHPTDQTLNEAGGPGGYAGDAKFDVQGTLQAKEITVVRRDGSMDFDVDRLLVPEGETTTITVIGTEEGDVTFDYIVVEEDATLIIDNSEGAIDILNPIDVADTGTVIITNPGNIKGDDQFDFTATTPLVSPLQLPAGGGTFFLPVTGTGLANAQVAALLAGQFVEIAGVGAPERTATEAWLPVRFAANTSQAVQTYSVLVSNGARIWIPLALDVEVAVPGGSNPPLDFRVVTEPSLSGSPEVGATLTINPGAWVPDPTLSYAWLRDGVAIPGATTLTYTVDAADAGATIAARITATGNGMKTETRELTGLAIPLAHFTVTTEPTVTGTPEVGGTLTANPGVWTPTPTLAYQWLRDNAPIAGATADTYPVTADDLGTTLTVRITATAPGVETLTRQPGGVTVQLQRFTVSNEPAITGTPQVGSTLSLNPGTWNPTPTFTYEWLRGGIPVSGATGASYSLTAADAGTTISARVTGTAPGVEPSTRQAPGVAVPLGQFNVTTNPSLSGTPNVGSTLTLNPGVWAPSATLTYEWLRNGAPIDGVTSTTYTLVAADAGATIAVRVTGTGAGMESASRVTPGVSVPAGGGGGGGGDDNGGGGGGGGGDDNGGGGGGGGGGGQPPQDPQQVPQLPKDIQWGQVQVQVPGGVATVFLGIAGTARVGQTLTARVVTASTAAITYGYQWLRSGKAISGATKAKYKLVAKDRKKRVAVRLTATPAAGGTQASVLAPSKLIKIGVLKTTRPKITGTVRVGRTLKANATKWTAGTKKKYQWYRGSKKIAGATKAKYRVKAADRGRKLTVKVKGTKSGFKAVTRASAASRAIR
ncbi:MAG: hypothetical protein LBH48_06470 [Bifidobacteriaceae bacterium]|jgi:hypothetical protein|nr:hypothetical protein [Bifidobacteriaceae bacterium]